ncbi:fimbrial protein [Klebsiella huaxiensis]|uniref:fimbrial protein n=1 Tax=Klebsiella huaxiensis TaxID=2153354 RepID=UPI002F2C5FB2
MKILIVFFSLFGVSLQALAACAPIGTLGTPIAVQFKSISLDGPVGSILAAERRGNVAIRGYTPSNCSSEQFVINTSPAPTEAGITGVRGGKVYKTGIPGIGFQISDVTLGSSSNFIPAKLGDPENASNHIYSSNIGNQVMVWLIKTGNIDTSAISTAPTILVRWQVGLGTQIANPLFQNSQLSAVNIKLSNLLTKQASCEVSPTRGDIVMLDPIDVNQLNALTEGAATGKQKNIELKITCPDTEVGLDYSYWFNPISATHATKDGILLNSASGGASVGIIIKKDTTPIKFSYPNYSNYTFVTQKNQTLTLNADYYKLSNPVSIGTGEVKGIFEVVLQEK